MFWLNSILYRKYFKMVYLQVLNRGGNMGIYCLLAVECQFREMKKFLGGMVMMAAQQLNALNAAEPYIKMTRMVNFIFCIVCGCSVAQSCPTLFNPMDCSTPGLPVPYHLPEFTKFMSIESLMPSNHLVLCCPLLLVVSLSQPQGLFQWVGSLHQRAKVLELQLQPQSFQWIFKVDFL